MRADGGERAVEGAERRGHQRLFGKIAGVRHQIARGEIVGAVGDDVVAADQLERIFRGQPGVVLLHGDVGIEPMDRRRGAVDLRHADVGRRVDHLPLQIRQRHYVVVDDAERADAGGGEIKQNRRAEAAGADDQHAGAAERGLSRAAHLAQHDVARITLEFVGSQHGGNIIGPGGARRDYLWVNLAGRFAMKAAMPSFWSAVANSE